MAQAAGRSPGGQVRKTLFEDRSEGHMIRGWVTTDGLVAGLDCQMLASSWPGASARELVHMLDRHRVTHGVDPSALEKIAAAAREGRGTTGQVVARGTPPEPGRDGALEFIVRPSSEGARYQRDETGRIDYRETNLVQNVLVGEPVAIEIPPSPGREGIDIFGLPAPASAGQRAEFKVGEGARFEEKSRQVLALRDGRVIWDMRVVSVSGSYHVRGSVDYSVGNIAFVGEVIIDGDVLDGFNVRAGAGLTVGGNVGACRLDSEGGLTVRGGVFGKGRARIRAKGELSARFLNECQAECSGVLRVEREALGSTLLTNRCLMMPEGHLVGGTASALGGADVGALGSALGVPTTVSAGTDYNLARRQSEVEARIVQVDASAEKIGDFLGPLLADRRRMGRLLTRRRIDLEKLISALRGLRAERADLAAQLEELAEVSHRGAIRQINVRQRIFPGVLLELGAVRHRFKKAASGPLTVLQDRAKGALRTTEFVELPSAEEDRDAGKDST